MHLGQKGIQGKEEPVTMQVFVKALEGRTYSIEVESTDNTVSSIMCELQQKTGMQ